MCASKGICTTAEFFQLDWSARVTNFSRWLLVAAVNKYISKCDMPGSEHDEPHREAAVAFSAGEVPGSVTGRKGR